MGVELQVQAKALGDPTRHRIFRYIADAAAPVGVAELTDHVGLNHNAIRQHLVRTWRIVLDPQEIVAVLVHPGVQFVAIGASGRAKDLEHLDRYHEGKD